MIVAGLAALEFTPINEISRFRLGYTSEYWRARSKRAQLHPYPIRRMSEAPTNNALQPALKAEDWTLLKKLAAGGSTVANADLVAALNLAIERGSLKGLKILLKLRPDVNRGNSEGQTPLHLAAAFGREQIIRELIRFGADPLLKDKRGLIAPTLAYLLHDDLRLVRAFFHEAARGTRASP